MFQSENVFNFLKVNKRLILSGFKMGESFLKYVLIFTLTLGYAIKAVGEGLILILLGFARLAPATKFWYSHRTRTSSTTSYSGGKDNKKVLYKKNLLIRKRIKQNSFNYLLITY